MIIVNAKDGRYQYTCPWGTAVENFGDWTKDGYSVQNPALRALGDIRDYEPETPEFTWDDTIRKFASFATRAGVDLFEDEEEAVPVDEQVEALKKVAEAAQAACLGLGHIVQTLDKLVVEFKKYRVELMEVWEWQKAQTIEEMRRSESEPERDDGTETQGESQGALDPDPEQHGGAG